MESKEQSPREPVTGRKRDVVIWLDKRILGFAKTWALWIALITGLYAGLPVIAPIAMHNGATGVGNLIYTLYTPVCHQFAFRSWFLFGEQAAYPRALAGGQGRTFEEMAATEPFFDGIDPAVLDNDLIAAAKAFNGNERWGYKVAFCERDIAIYAAIALFAIVFYIAMRGFGVNIPPLPFWAYLLIAIAPIGLDGFSQLFANPPFNGFGLGIYPIRESTPFLRTLTGAMFGLGNAWLALPYIEESMAETRESLAIKLVNAGVMK